MPTDTHQSGKDLKGESHTGDSARYVLAEQQSTGFLTALLERTTPEEMVGHNEEAMDLIASSSDANHRLCAAATKLAEARDALSVFLRLAVSTSLFDAVDPDDFAEHPFPVLTSERGPASDALATHP